MKTRTVREILLLCAAVLAVACAVLLPPFLSRLSDRELETAQYAVQAESLDVSLVYQMSTAQRLALLNLFNEEDSVLSFRGGQPAQDELSGGQAASLCREELERLVELGVLPAPVSLSDTAFSAQYLMLCDREDRQRSVSLWVLSSFQDAGSDYGYACNLVMDAQTGLIYSLRVALEGTPEFSPEDAARAWGTYLELGAPTVQEEYEVPPSAGEGDLYSWVSTGLASLSAAYETDDGTVSCFFQWERDPYSKPPLTTVAITPFSPSGS